MKLKNRKALWQFLFIWVLMAIILRPTISFLIARTYFLFYPEQAISLFDFEATFGFISSRLEFSFLGLMIFSTVIAFGQDWLFRKFLNIRIPHWVLATLIGSYTGSILYYFYFNTPPFSALSWFGLVGLLQAWTMRRITNRAWLWALAHIAVSFFFPTYIYGDMLYTTAKWLLATGVYAFCSILTLRELARNARIDKLSEE